MTERAPRVLYVSTASFVGGGEQVALNLIRERTRLGSPSCLANLTPTPGPLLPLARAAGATAYHLARGRFRDLPGSLQASIRLAGLARRLQIDLFHSNDIRAVLYTWLAQRLTRRPSVWHVHDLLDGGNFTSGDSIARVSSQLGADRVVAISQAVAAALPARLRRSTTVQVIHNGIDLAPFQTATGGALRAELGIAPDTPLIGFVGRLLTWKRPDDFIAAMAIVAEQAPRARFLVAGDSLTDEAELPSALAYRASLHALVERLGLAGRLTFLGHRDDIPEIMAALDVFVLPTLAEPFGLVVVEAMAANAAVVATNAGGVPEIVRDGETGLLAPPGQPPALAAAVLRLLTRPAERRALVAAAQARAQAEFSLGAQVRAFEALYQRLAARACPARGRPHPEGIRGRPG